MVKDSKAEILRKFELSFLSARKRQLHESRNYLIQLLAFILQSSSPRRSSPKPLTGREGLAKLVF
jgi:hypothetical protein